VGVELGDRDYQQALLTVAGGQNLAVFAPFEHALETVEAQAGLGPLRPVAPDAGCLENRVDVLIVSHTLLRGSRRQLAGIDGGGGGQAGGSRQARQ
jgi:hypothetical protein